MHGKGVGPALGLVLLLLAGCFGTGPSSPGAAADLPALAGLSEARFPILSGQNVWIPATSDGTQLHGRLFLPDVPKNPEWKAPTILVMSPYFGYDARTDIFDAASPSDYFRYEWLRTNFVARGYALALMDVRGTGDSGGCLEQTGQLQWQDGYDTVEWLAAQPWSNGRVGMFGKSYDAETQQSTAVKTPPHLTTIVPVSSVSGQYEYNFYDGVPYTAQALASNAAYMATDGLQAPTTDRGIAQFPTRPGCHVEILARGVDMSGDWDQFWEDREIRHHVQEIKASVLSVHGLQDWNVKMVAIRDWFDQIPSEKRAIYGQWNHDYPEQNRQKAEWSRQDWRTTVHKWYDYWLLGIENGIMQELPPVQIQDSAGLWRQEPTFPPTDAKPLTLHLGPGKLETAPVVLKEPLRVRENEEGWTRAMTGLPTPTADSAPYADRLVFESEALAVDLHASGWPVLSFTATMSEMTTRKDTTDAHFAVTLYDVAPDGKPSWFNRGYLSARHRLGLEHPTTILTGVPYEFSIRLFPQDTFVSAGHRLRLEFAGSDDWTQPEGSFWAAEIAEGTLTIPTIERDWGAVKLNVPMGPPIDH